MQSVQGEAAESSAMLCDGENNPSPKICCCSLEGLGVLWEPSLYPLFFPQPQGNSSSSCASCPLVTIGHGLLLSPSLASLFSPGIFPKDLLHPSSIRCEALRHFTSQYIVWLMLKGSWEPQVKVSKISIPSHLSPTFWYIYRTNVIAESWVNKDHELLKNRLMCPYACSNYTFCLSCS